MILKLFIEIFETNSHSENRISKVVFLIKVTKKVFLRNKVPLGSLFVVNGGSIKICSAKCSKIYFHYVIP